MRRMLHRHDWVKVEGKMVEIPDLDLLASGAGFTNGRCVAEVALPGDAPFRAQVEPPGRGESFTPPGVGEVTGFLVNTKDRRIRFDDEDPRNHAPNTWTKTWSAPGFSSTTTTTVYTSNVEVHRNQLSPELQAKLDHFLQDGSGLAALLERTIAASKGLGGMTVTRVSTSGPPWDVPERCPNCGATVDQAKARFENDPHCAFCQHVIPVTAHVTGRSVPVTPAIDRSHDQLGASARVLALGQPVQAMLVSAGLMPNVANAAGEGVMALTLEVTPPGGGQPYQTQVGCHVPEQGKHLLVPGTILPAKVMPDEPAVVVIDWTAAG